MVVGECCVWIRRWQPVISLHTQSSLHALTQPGHFFRLLVATLLRLIRTSQFFSLIIDPLAQLDKLEQHLGVIGDLKGGERLAVE